MRLSKPVLIVGGLAMAAVIAGGVAAAGGAGSCTSCTGPGLEPRCKATWDEAKTKQPQYAMQCEYACARARDPWHAPGPDCRCSPPSGNLYVKKRLYKTEKEKVERVPKYEVEAVPATPCGCAACSGGGRHAGWDPLGLLFPFHHR